MVVCKQENIRTASDDILRIMLRSAEPGISGIRFPGKRELHIRHAKVRPAHFRADFLQEGRAVIVQLAFVHHHVSYDIHSESVPAMVKPFR
ncbi:MAG: hypothetical protein MJY43_04695 [Bacteroidales bacterium]|nr:hypothetical protein [Bacteroidales bacterium]